MRTPTVSWGLGRALLGLVPVALLAWALRASGLLQSLDHEALQAEVASYGWLGPLLFIALYGAGMIAQIPAYLFIGAAVLAYGAAGGFMVSYLGALVANFGVFAAIRCLRGASAFSASAWEQRAPRPLKRLLARIRGSRLWSELDRRPYVVVALIRVAFPANPIVTLAFAVTGVALGAYVVGSMVGAVPQLAVTVLLLHWAVAAAAP